MSENYDFTIYKSNRLENEKFLHEALAIIKKLSEKAPLKKKSIIVQSDGMARWLTLKAAADAGVFANFEFVSPDVFLRNFAEKYFGITADSVYNKKNAEWSLYSLVRNEKTGAAGRYIGGNEARAFRFSRVVADLFEQYFVYRPNMMKLWQEEKKASSDYNESWQYEIFRRLAKAGNVGMQSFAQVFKEKCRTASLENSDYPDTLILFGISIMNKYQLDMFRELSRLFPVRLFAMSPSREYFSLSKKKGGFDSAEQHELSADDLPDTFFGRFCAAGLDFLNFTSGLNDESDFEMPEGKRLLKSLQRDILNDAEMPEKIENDDSVQIISCRDKMREIEVLKDNLLELFKENGSLKPEDVAVMAPKINDYVPYITAVFGGTDPDDKTYIPWVISDRTFSSESRIAATFLEILKLGSSNFEKSKVLSIFRSPCVCAKFGIDEKTLGDIEKIIDESGVRWGLDADSRGDGSGGSRQNTWDFGLSRIMMSQLMPFPENGDGFEGILPMESLSKEDFGNISPFITFAKELFRYSRILSSAEQSPAEFKNMLEGMLDFFFACDPGSGVSEEIRHIRSVIDDFAETAGKFSDSLSFDALRQYLEDELGRERSGRGFLSAKVNFCSLKPLRALPFKVICLIGMSDGAFPRNENRYAFDLTQKKEPGASVPRSVRDNDKYLFVEAVVSAREKLFISYEAGDFSEDSKKHCRAAMPVQILEKYIEAKTGTKAEELETKYPVQPFSGEYFKKEGSFRTFSMRDFKLARSMFHVEQNAPDPDAERVSEQETEKNADLDKLTSFFKDPIKFYLTKTLKIALPDDSNETGDEELFDYSGDNLLAYGIRKTYIDMAQVLQGSGNVDEAFFRRMKNEGKIPFGAFGEAELKGFAEDSNLSALAGNITGKNLDFEDITLDFEDLPLKLQGRIKNIERPDRMILVFPVKCKDKYQIEAVIRHLAANAYGINADTHLCFIDKNLILKKLPADSAKNALYPFLKLWKFGKRHMPLFDPELIVKTAETEPADVPAALASFFEDKWLRRNDEHAFLSQEFLVAAEQFLHRNRKTEFLREFPVTEVLEIGKLWNKFYSSKKDKNSK